MANNDVVESPDEMQRALHDLRVHQIELEMQNEELRRLQLELDATRQRYFDLYNFAPAGYLVLSEQGLILQVNLAAASLVATPRADLFMQPLHKFIFSADQDSFYLHHKQLINTGYPQSYDLRMVTNEGTQFWANLAATFTRDSDEQPLLRVVLSDITARKQAEVAIQMSEAAKQDILNSISAHIAVLDHDGIILAVNDPWRRFAQENSIAFSSSLSTTDVGTNYLLACQPVGTGLATKEIMIAHDGIQAVLDRSQPSFSLEYPCHSRLEQRWFCMSVTPLGATKQGGVVITHTNITQRKQAELAVLATQEQLESMTSQVPGVVYQFVLTVSGAWQFLYISKGIEELYEVASDDVIRDFSVLTKYILAEDKAAHQEAVENLAQNPCQWEHQHRIRTPSGKIKWILGRANPKRQTDGSILWSGFLTDITEQKRAEVDIKESEQRYRAFLEDASDTILIVDMNGNIEEVNRSGELLLGYTKEDLRGMNMTQIHPASEMSKVKREFKEIVTNGSISSVETKILRKNGQMVDVEIRPTLIKIGGRVLVQGIFIDLTERKHFEDERIAHEILLRSVLVREVHHRIKNNLQGITGMLRQFIQTHPETAIPINQAISQVQSISVIHGLQGRAFTSSVRACELTAAIASGIEALWQKSILVEIPEGWIPCIITEAEAVPLALVLNELILNAVKHSPKHEQVRINLSHKPHSASLRLDIENMGHLPAGFGLEDATSFGTGLQLAVSLLPRAGAILTWTQQSGSVITTLDLDDPVIKLEAST